MKDQEPVQTEKLVTCPNCGHGFTVKVRGKIGEGTGKRMRKVTLNKQALLWIAYEEKRFLHVRQFQAILFEKGIKRYKKGDKEGNPTAEWNYHHVQAELSLLVGNDLLTMCALTPMLETGKKNGTLAMPQEFYDKILDMFRADPVPRYYLDFIQKLRCESIKDKRGDLRWLEDIRPAEQRGLPFWWPKT